MEVNSSNLSRATPFSEQIIENRHLKKLIADADIGSEVYRNQVQEKRMTFILTSYTDMIDDASK